MNFLYKNRIMNTIQTAVDKLCKNYALDSAKKWANVVSKKYSLNEEEVYNLMTSNMFDQSPVEKQRQVKRSGYLLYCSKFREQIKKENPEKMNKQITTILASMWNNLSDTEKGEYNKQAMSEVDTKSDLVTKSSTELRKLCKEKNLKNYSTLDKPSIIKLLEKS
jgi:hypothetical protein